MENIIIK